MTRVRVYVDPELREEFGPEVCWILRLVLTTIGYAWQEVPTGEECDVAYAWNGNRPSRALVTIRPEIGKWRNRAALRLEAVDRHHGITSVRYGGEPCRNPLTDCRPWTCRRDLFFDLFWLITGQEERAWPSNVHGHLTAPSVYQQSKLFREGIASDMIGALEEALAAQGLRIARPRWPDGKKAAACVTHDVDYPEVVRWLEPLRVLRRRGLRNGPVAWSVLSGKRTHWHFQSWVAAEREFGVRSAFYFVARRGSLLRYVLGTPDPFYDVKSDRFRRLFGYLAEQDCETGIHASYRAFQSRIAFADEKALLERASGQAICGGRHHYWHLNPADPEDTLLIHEEIGLEYDCSIAHEQYLGWRRNLTFPYFPFHQARRRQIRTLQIPTGWMDDHLFGHEEAVGPDSETALASMSERIVRQGGCFMVDVHDYVFDDALFPNWSKAYLQLLNSFTSDYWIRKPAEIARHWSQRYQSLLETSRGLDG